MSKNKYLKTCAIAFLLLGLSSCSRKPATLTFVSDLHTPTMCGPLPVDKNYHVDTFAFFISEIEARIDNEWKRIEFMPSADQTSTSALIDLTPRCESGKQTKVSIPLALSHHQFGDVDSLRFYVGVPFAQNHANPLSAPPPLNHPDMFWSWQTGHKFIRFDLSHNYSGDAWSFHLGSVGCTASSALRAPKEDCQSQHLYQYQLDRETNQGVIMVRPTLWLQQINLETSSGCMFKIPAESDCATLVEAVQKPWLRWVRS